MCAGRAGVHAPATSQRLRRDAPLLKDSLRAGLLLAELLCNVPVDFACIHQVCPWSCSPQEALGSDLMAVPKNEVPAQRVWSDTII